MNQREVGAKKEEQAGEYLKSCGYELEAKNYHCRFGAISPTKIKRICKTSQFYLWEHKLPEDTPVRYDVVFIIGDECRLVRDAFSFFG